jgi:polysaccharide biosynthesis/export protein
VNLCGRTQSLLIILCASTFAVPAAWTQQATPQQQSPGASDAPPSGAAPPVAPNYVIGPGDVLQVFVWRNPELTVTVPVRPDGRITTPLVEDMTASGRTSEELARNIEVVLAEYIRSPQVNVIVTAPRGINSEVKAVGQVRTPQGVAYREGMRVLDLILAVGGLTEFAAGNRAKVVRRHNGKTVEIPVKLGAILNGGNLERNIELKPGDVLVVPEAFF